MNKKKRKRDDDFDYIYGIVTTGRDWHFLLYTPEEIKKGSKLSHIINFTDDALIENSKEYEILYKGVQEVLSIIVGLLMDRACVEPNKKRARINELTCSQ